MLQKCEGIVIRTVDYGETNKVVTLYTREWGKIGMMARGAKKLNSRLAAVTQLFTYGNYLIQMGSGLGNLQQGEIISFMPYIREDLFLTAYASFIVELTDKGTEDRKSNPYLFELLLQTLRYMDEGIDPEIMTFIYEMKMLGVIGLYPNLNQCTICGSTEGVFSFSIREGGLICHRCLDKDPYHYKLSQNAIKLLRIFYYLDLSRIGKVSVKQETKNEIRTVIDAYYEEYSGLHLKTKRFLRQLAQLEPQRKHKEGEEPPHY